MAKQIIGGWDGESERPPPSRSLLLVSLGVFFALLKLDLSSLCSEPPSKHFILLHKPAFSLLGQCSLGGDQTDHECFLAHA